MTIYGTSRLALLLKFSAMIICHNVLMIKGIWKHCCHGRLALHDFMWVNESEMIINLQNLPIVPQNTNHLSAC